MKPWNASYSSVVVGRPRPLGHLTNFFYEFLRIFLISKNSLKFANFFCWGNEFSIYADHWPINQNSEDFSSVKCHGDNVCVYSKVFGVGEFKYANTNFRGAKGVAIATKFTQKYQKCTDFSSGRHLDHIFPPKRKVFANFRPPNMRKCASSDSAKCFLVLPSAYTNTPAPIFTINTSNDVVSRKCAF